MRSYINVTFAPIYVFMDDKNKHNDDENVRNFGMHIDPLVGLFFITFYSLNCFNFSFVETIVQFCNKFSIENDILKDMHGCISLI